MHIYTPYTYLIGWSHHNKWYYGARYAKGCHPSDLWVKYFTSSKYVNEYRKKYGEPDVIQIRKTFNSHDETLKWEEKVLKRMNVSKENKWLNVTHNRGFPLISELPIETQKRRSKLISESSKNRVYPKGRIVSEETREKIRTLQKEVWGDYSKDEYEKRCEKYKESQKKISKETREKQFNKIRKTIDSKPDIVCPHCGKTSTARGASAMSRHHFDNCKNINQKSIKIKKLVEDLQIEISKIKYSTEQFEIKTGCYIKTRKLKTQRREVKEIKVYLKKYKITLGQSWYQKSTSWLEEILNILQIFDDKIADLEKVHMCHR